MYKLESQVVQRESNVRTLRVQGFKLAPPHRGNHRRTQRAPPPRRRPPGGVQPSQLAAVTALARATKHLRIPTAVIVVLKRRRMPGARRGPPMLLPFCPGRRHQRRRAPPAVRCNPPGARTCGGRRRRSHGAAPPVRRTHRTHRTGHACLPDQMGKIPNLVRNPRLGIGWAFLEIPQPLSRSKKLRLQLARYPRASRVQIISGAGNEVRNNRRRGQASAIRRRRVLVIRRPLVASLGVSPVNYTVGHAAITPTFSALFASSGQVTRHGCGTISQTIVTRVTRTR